MKSLKRMLLTNGVLTFAVSFASAVPLNNGFESGDLADWTVNIPVGYSEYDPLPRSAGTVAVTSSWQRGSMPGAKTAEEMNYFLAIGSKDSGFFTNSSSHEITVSQTLFMQQGQTLTGMVSFYNGDHAAQDSAWVKILDATTFDLLATPWQDYSGSFPDQPSDNNSVLYRNASNWTPWQWTAAVTGEYTLTFGVTTQGDNCFGSYGFFDAVGVYAAVPEPAAATLLLMGLAGIQVWRRKSRA